MLTVSGDETNRSLGLSQVLQRPLVRGIDKGEKASGFENQPFSTGWPPYTEPLIEVQLYKPYEYYAEVWKDEFNSSWR